MLDIAVILVYFAVMLGVGWYSMRRAHTTEDFLVAGRRLGYPLYAGTLAAVVLGGASTIGGVRLGYQYGISGMWLVFMLGLGIVVLSLFISRLLSRLKLYSVAELLGRRYGVAPRVISGIVMTAYDLMVAVTAAMAIGAVFSVVLDIDRSWAIAIGTAIVVTYSVLGGMWSITLTDIIQFVVMSVGMFLLLLPFSLARAGGLEGLRETLPASYFDIGAIGTDTIVTYFLIYVFGIIIGQDIWQRVFTARDSKVASRAGVFAGVYCIAYAICGALIGMAGRVVLPELAVPDNAFAEMAGNILPAGIAGFVLAAALAAIMSTASACLLAASTLLSRDVFSRTKDSLGRERIFILGVGAVVIVIALAVQDVVAGLTIAYNLLVGGLFVPIVGGLVWRRASAAGALAAMSVGSVVVIILMLTQGLLANEPIYFGLTASLASFVVGSLLRPSPYRSIEPAASGDQPLVAAG